MTDIDGLLLDPISVRIDSEQTSLRLHRDLITVVRATKGQSDNELFKLYGIGRHKFALEVKDNALVLRFVHRVRRDHVYRLILAISGDDVKRQLTLIPIEVYVLP